ncbi:MAG: hypothetical protein ACHREM_05220 [Polyangiales bacterium]
MGKNAEDNAADAGVHRLVDMVVEEVSLVDRAANKHRFLVVKRDAPMKSKTDPKGAGATDPNEDPEAPEMAPKKKPKAQRSEAAKADTADALATATAILERLTSAIELLGEASGDDATELLTELSAELSEAASEIAEAAGVADADEEDEETDKRASVGDAVTKVRALLSEVKAILAPPTSSAPVAPPPVAPASAAAPIAPAVDGQITQQMKSIHTTLDALAIAMKDQSTRLGRIEKGTPLPNSRAHEERPRARPDAEVSWPFDLNRPLDRESVAKGESFHDTPVR